MHERFRSKQNSIGVGVFPMQVEEAEFVIIIPNAKMRTEIVRLQLILCRYVPTYMIVVWDL